MVNVNVYVFLALSVVIFSQLSARRGAGEGRMHEQVSQFPAPVYTLF